MTQQIEEFNYSVDLLQALLWRFNNAPKIQQLIQYKNDWYDLNENEFWNDWFTNVFDLNTANTFGLTVWSILLGLPLFLPINPDPPGKPLWGFGNFNQNFNNGNFTNSQSSTGLTDEQKRLILKLRYFQLVTRCDTPTVNAFLQYVQQSDFQVYVLDGLDMSITYVFKTRPDQQVLRVLLDYDILPRGSGVKLKTVDLTRKTWGFGPFNQNFSNGTFIES